MSLKRKAESADTEAEASKRTRAPLAPEVVHQRFRQGLFETPVVDSYREAYAQSTPYRHHVIHQLVNDDLLRSARNEIRDNVTFTPKETDIYKIHQSVDLANLDGLGDAAFEKLPSLMSLRDALYSETFRQFVSNVTGCGPLSGRKTDMAINVYTPGCFLLCHDDVIGSRKISYILYLTDPDTPWKPEWGGALRLYPVQERVGKDGVVAKTPSADFTTSYPPEWNQLSFFAVQPGESFHDVEEVYHADDEEQLQKEGGRIRMAISGWFHIPQEGEDGYVPGEEERIQHNSGLLQLQGDPDQYDLPQPKTVPVKTEDEKTAEDESATKDTEKSEDGDGDEDDEGLSVQDFEFLLQYIAPQYLAPDTLEPMEVAFEAESSLTLPNILTPKFAERLRAYVEAQEKEGLPTSAAEITEKTDWNVAVPPHKHRYLYQQRDADVKVDEKRSPVAELVHILFPSVAFQKWLSMATGCTLETMDVMARRFRRGLDYTLATGYEGKPRLEINLGFTPTEGWGDVEDDEDDEDDEDEDEEDREEKEKSENGGNDKQREASQDKGTESAETKSEVKEDVTEEEKKDDKEVEVGGHEVYMATDEEEAAADAAVYQAGSGDDDDEILFFQAAAWNKMTIVLRDSHTLRFVKYVSRRAPGDRWDVSAVYDVEELEAVAVDAGDEEDYGEEEGEDEGEDEGDEDAEVDEE